MAGRWVTLVPALVLVSAGAGGSSPAQSNPYSKLIGTWVMDSTNGVDDKGLPKSEKLVFSRAGSALRITATEDDGAGPSTSTFNCPAAPAADTTRMGPSMDAVCTIRPTADSVMYSIDMIDKSKSDVVQHWKAIPTERGRLVVQSNGLLRDQYDAMTDTPPTHHRHIYHKV